jgi:hypothetical protein
MQQAARQWSRSAISNHLGLRLCTTATVRWARQIAACASQAEMELSCALVNKERYKGNPKKERAKLYANNF